MPAKTAWVAPAVWAARPRMQQIEPVIECLQVDAFQVHRLQRPPAKCRKRTFTSVVAHGTADPAADRGRQAQVEHRLCRQRHRQLTTGTSDQGKGQALIWRGAGAALAQARAALVVSSFLPSAR